MFVKAAQKKSYRRNKKFKKSAFQIVTSHVKPIDIALLHSFPTGPGLH